MKLLFLSYTDADGNDVAPFYRLLEDQESYKLIERGAKMMGKVTTKIQTEGTGTDPILEIVAITNERIPKSEVEAISQGAIDWLMDNGHMEHRQ